MKKLLKCISFFLQCMGFLLLLMIFQDVLLSSRETIQDVASRDFSRLNAGGVSAIHDFPNISVVISSNKSMAVYKKTIFGYIFWGFASADYLASETTHKPTNNGTFDAKTKK